MIELIRGDILRTDAEALVNTVNCVGVMGRGIALQFRKAFPENYSEYKALCDENGLRIGTVFVHDTGRCLYPRYIINFPTKRHWKGKSRIEDIEAGLKALVQEIRSRNIRSIAIPPLGCGLGGLDWQDVEPRIRRALEPLPNVRVLLFEPSGAPKPVAMAKGTTAPKMTSGRAALIGLMRRYLAAVMDPHVSLLEIHKLMYFMQEAGQPLRLKYEKGIYGPYARNLRHLLNHIEGHFITGYGDAEDRPGTPIELKSDAAELAEQFLQGHTETRNRFDRVVDLIQGFETPFGMELLSTVHWVVTRDGARSLDDVLTHAYEWNDRKLMFQKDQMQAAYETLIAKGWI